MGHLTADISVEQMRSCASNMIVNELPVNHDAPAAPIRVINSPGAKFVSSSISTNRIASICM